MDNAEIARLAILECFGLCAERMSLEQSYQLSFDAIMLTHDLDASSSVRARGLVGKARTSRKKYVAALDHIEKAENALEGMLPEIVQGSPSWAKYDYIGMLRRIRKDLEFLSAYHDQFLEGNIVKGVSNLQLGRCCRALEVFLRWTPDGRNLRDRGVSFPANWKQQLSGSSVDGRPSSDCGRFVAAIAKNFDAWPEETTLTRVIPAAANRLRKDGLSIALPIK